MRAAVGLTDGLGLDGDRCIRVIPRQRALFLGRFNPRVSWSMPIFYDKEM